MNSIALNNLHCHLNSYYWDKKLRCRWQTSQHRPMDSSVYPAAVIVIRRLVFALAQLLLSMTLRQQRVPKFEKGVTW